MLPDQSDNRIKPFHLSLKHHLNFLPLFYFPFPTVNGLDLWQDGCASNQMLIQQKMNDLLRLFPISTSPKNLNLSCLKAREVQETKCIHSADTYTRHHRWELSHTVTVSPEDLNIYAYFDLTCEVWRDPYLGFRCNIRLENENQPKSRDSNVLDLISIKDRLTGEERDETRQEAISRAIKEGKLAPFCRTIDHQYQWHMNDAFPKTASFPQTTTGTWTTFPR